MGDIEDRIKAWLEIGDPVYLDGKPYRISGIPEGAQTRFILAPDGDFVPSNSRFAASFSELEIEQLGITFDRLRRQGKIM